MKNAAFATGCIPCHSPSKPEARKGIAHMLRGLIHSGYRFTDCLKIAVVFEDMAVH